MSGFKCRVPLPVRFVENEVRYSGTGASYASASLFGGNRLRDNSIGIVTTVDSSTDGLGFFGELPPNLIYRNAIGVQLVQARMQNQLVSNNSSGVIGSGSLEPIDLAHANRIVRNQTGFRSMARYNSTVLIEMRVVYSLGLDS